MRVRFRHLLRTMCDNQLHGWALVGTTMFMCIASWSSCGLAIQQPGSTSATSTAASPELLEWFERDVRPLLAEHCYSCHSSTVERPKGGLTLDSLAGVLNGGDSGPAAVKGKPNDSLMIEAVRRQSLAMPPDKPLSRRDQATLARWIEVGMPWPEAVPAAQGTSDWVMARAATHWAWQPIKPSSPPDLQDDHWSLRPLDHFVASEHRIHGVEPSPPADSLTRLRRLSFDLTGLPPTREQALRANSGMTTDAYEALVDEHLSSPQFGVHWGRHWLDLLRYCETLGHEFDYPVHNAWQYRDATVDAFNIDLPYKQIIEEHLAGDLLEKPRKHPLSGINQSLAATGWWWMGDTVHAPVDVRADWATRIDNQIDVLSKTFLGMTVACARCHDHKFDAISLKDYYGLVGVVQSSRRIYRPTDPLGRIAAHEQKLDQRLRDAEQSTSEAVGQLAADASAIRQWLDSLCDALRSQHEKLETHLPLSSPLYCLRAVVAEDFTATQTTLRSELDRAQRAFQNWQEASPLFADFSQGLPSGWSLHTATEGHAAALADRSAPQISDWFSTKWPLPQRADIFTSQRFGKQASVILQSPIFDVQKPMMCLKLRGKAATSVVHVSNYFMHEFTGLLFADLRKGIDQPLDNGWVTHAGDLVKYLGYPAFLSLEDNDAGWFEIQQVRFADQPPPVQPFVIPKPMEDAFADRQALLACLAGQLSEAMRTVGATGAESAPHMILREALQLSDRLNVAPPAIYSNSLAATATELNALDQDTPPPVRLTTIAEGTPVNASVAIRGNPHQLGPSVQRGCFSDLKLGWQIPPGSSGRWELSQAWTSPRHPLVARVMVNRVWHYLMGDGLVSSTDNLGVLGGRPTHPALLDYLSTEFVRHDWSIKWLVREIVLSQTYQLSSRITEQQRQLDADHRLWSHRSVKRLTGESLRDAMLAVADSLDVRLGDPSTAIHLKEQMTGRGRPKTSGPLDGDNRRSMFIEVRRNFLDPFLMAFDFPMPATSVGKRNVSNVPAQALGLLNDPLVTEVAKRWSRQMSSPTSTAMNDQAAIEAMFVTAYARPPSRAELDDCLELIRLAGDDTQQRQQAWNDLAHVLINAKEFSYVR